MSHINPNKCYTVTPAEAVTDDTPLNVDELAAILTSLSERTNEIIKDQLNRFVGPRSTYTYKTGLIESLRKVFIHLKNPEVPDNEKRVIADKLFEGFGACTPGFHDRVNSIVISLVRPRSIDAILERIRYSIVESVARSYTGEVHLHNSFFSAAATLGYGVRPINRQDIYSGFLNPSQLNALRKTFTQKYTSFSILNDLQVNIESELRSYFGYEGKKPIGDPYKRGPIDKMVEFLNTILGSAYTERQFFIWEENKEMLCDVQTDLNWTFIQDCLWKKLKNEKYIIFSKEEENLFHALYHADQTRLASLLKEPRYRKLFYSVDFIKYPQAIKSLDQRKVIATALAEQTSGMSIEQLLRYTQLLQTFFPDDSALKKHYLQVAAKKWLEKRTNFNLISMIKLDEQRALLVIYENLSEEQLKALFSKPSRALENLLLLSAIHNNAELCFRLINLVKESHIPTSEKLSLLFRALHSIVKSHPATVPQIIDVMASLEPGMQKKLFAEKDGNGDSILMAAVNKQPTALPHLLDFIRTFDMETKKAILTIEWDDRKAVLGLAAFYQPTAVPHLLDFIRTLDIETQRAILTKQNRRGENALMQAIPINAAAASLLIDFIKTFDIETQQAILTAKNDTGYNALMLMMNSHHQLPVIPQLINLIKTFDVETQETILAAQNMVGNNALMEALYCRPLADAELLLDFIKTFDPERQKTILAAEDTHGKNALLIAAAKCQPTTVLKLLTCITSLDVKTQKKICTAKCKFYNFFNSSQQVNAITFVLKAGIIDNDQILQSISGYDWEAQLEILKESSRYFPAIKARRQQLIHEAMNQLKQGSPLERVIYKQLQSMKFNASSKQEAILAAIDTIRKSRPANMDAAIKEIIAQPTSGLRQALSQRRYTLFPPMTSQTRSLEKVMEAANSQSPMPN